MATKDDEASGFSKITGGLADLINLLVNLDKDGDLPHRGRREKNGMVVEYSVGKSTLGGSRVEPRAANETRSKSAHRTAKRADIEVIEPATDVFDEANETVLLFELPGVSRSDIHCTLDGDILLLDAKATGRLYRKEVLIEAKLADGPPELRLHNGILEVRLTKQP
jgi:HSP20 family protein